MSLYCVVSVGHSLRRTLKVRLSRASSDALSKNISCVCKEHLSKCVNNMAYKIYQNGFYLDENRAHISFYDRGFLAGEGLFETLRVTQGHVLFFEEHFARLSDSAKVLDFKLPVSCARLKFLTLEMLHMNKI